MSAPSQARKAVGARSAVRAIGDRLPHGWRDAGKQLALWALADLLYEGVRGIVEGRGVIALANGSSIISLEKQLGFFWEPHLQALVLPHHELMEVANWVYLNAQFTVNLLFLGVIYCYRNEVFYFVRNMFFVAMGIALTVHLIVPVAPPRLYPRYGFVDSIHQIAHINQDSGAIGVFVNPYAAVPSMHMCFALLVGVSAFRVARGPLLRAFALIYPVLVLVVIVVTANHFIFDAATGALTAIIAAVAAQRVMARARPQAWSWGHHAPLTPHGAASAPATESLI